jgi:hypothetical protein
MAIFENLNCRQNDELHNRFSLVSGLYLPVANKLDVLKYTYTLTMSLEFKYM